MAQAIFGGGCFWCTEAVFKLMKGVSAVMPGYAGGSAAEANYYAVSTGKTGHVEVVAVEYDPVQVNYSDLLLVFFGSHDPTTINRQGNDVGPQYRSVIFYTTPEQRVAAEQFINEINNSATTGAKIVTTVEPLDKFYPAESYHQDYLANNPDNPYCQLVINPKLEKVQKQYANLLKTLDQ
jgi:peptide-methionine (S)-S-oxide reductase